MSADAPLARAPAAGQEPDPARIDQRVTLRGVGWDDYEAILRARGEHGGVRITFLEGVLELMTPSVFHESLRAEGERYERTPGSELFPALDPALVLEGTAAPSQTEAVRLLRSRLRGVPQG